MFLRLLKYIGKVKAIFVFALSLMIYTLLCFINDGSNYSLFQHPYLTMVLLSGFLLLVIPFDFQNIMFSTRFVSLSSCRIKSVVWLFSLAFFYLFILFICFLPIGISLGDDFSIQKVIIFLTYSLTSLLIVIIMLVFLSAKIGTIITKIFLFCFIFAGFALNFAGGFFVNINFIFYNINSAFTWGLMVNSLMVYTTILSFLYVISFVKDKEL